MLDAKLRHIFSQVFLGSIDQRPDPLGNSVLELISSRMLRYIDSYMKNFMNIN